MRPRRLIRLAWALWGLVLACLAGSMPFAVADQQGTAELAAQVVKLRDTDRLSWLKIGVALKLAEGAATPKAAASRARTLYRLVKGQDADTGPLANS